MNIFSTFVESLILIRLCNKFLGFKSNKWSFVKSFVFFLIIFSTSLFIGLILEYRLLLFGIFSAALFLLLCFVYCALFLKGKVYEKLLISASPIFILYPVKLLTAIVFRSSDYPFAVIDFATALFSVLIYFFICELIIRKRRRKDYSLSPFQWGIQTACFLITFLIAGLILIYAFEGSGNPLPILWIFLLIAILNVLLYIMMKRMQRSSVIKEEYRLSQINLAAQEKFAVETRERYSEMRTLRHDMKHYFTAAAELLSDGKYDEAKDYIERVLDEKIIPSAVGVSTGSAIVDAVINNRIAVCAQNGIEMKCVIDSVFGGNDIDISILLSNLLDNAINGCDRQNPKLELVMGTKKSLTYVIVKNSIERSVLAENPELKTDDADKSSHGFGIGSVRRIAEKHGGSVEFKEEDNLFIAEVWLEK
ncbi:MAG: GHKL domain-containing protein [Oscillospiraceae bacterium]|nr:GHKL domain-containing protein [Oscillospiraceae bacterium]